MPGDPNKLSRFWQELKRRKVLRVITVYAAVAFVILQLVEILAPSLRLPEWTMNLILVLLIVGFIIAIILSWIYDVHPEGGIVKTEPVHKVKPGEEHAGSNSWKIASYISFVVIVGLIVLNIIPRANNKKEIFDKSIAVLPFINDSPTAENEYVINGYMASVHDNLCRIKDLKVLSLLSTEQYRSNPKPIPEIAREQDVSYLLSGRGQMYDKKIRLIVQLTDADDNIIWSHSFDKQINEVDDHINIQSEIARMIAAEINVIITPEEVKLMNKLPTSNISAYTYWLLGNEEEIKIINRNMSSNYNAALDRAEELYYLALEHDSTYSKAYAGLASVYWNKYHDKEYYTETFLDSAVVLIDKALSYDEDLASAHKLKGDYYYRTGKPDEALKEYDRALELNPNDWQIYMGLGRIYLGDDLTKELMNYHKAAALNQGKGLSEILRSISSVYRDAGFNAKSRYYLEQLLTLKGDSIQYLIGLSGILYYEREYERSIELYKKAFRKDTNNIDLLIRLGEISLEIGNYEEALVAYEKYVNSRENFRSVEGHNSHRIAHAYWVNGNQEKANYYFDKQLEYCQADIALGRSWGNLYYPYYDIAGIYAFRGEYERAFENLRMFSQKERHPLWMVDVIRIDPLFNSIRDEPEFQQIVRDVEAKYQAEHEKVRKWLEENDR